MASKYDAVVLGAGVIGMSIALELADRGLRPAIVARDLPEDLQSLAFASPWAGCNWHSFESDGSTPAAKYDRITFTRLAKLAAEHPHLCQRVPFIDVFSKPVPPPWFKDLVGDFEEVHASPGYPLPGNQPYAHKCSSYIINAPGYICHLSSLAQQKGIPIIRHLIGNLDEAFHLPELGRVGLVVNATSLGARTLKGVEDPKVFPARGQTVLVRAPGVKVCIMQTEGFMAKHSLDGKPVLPPAYIIPRPGPDGHVILGGTYFHSFSTDPDPIESERILKSCYALEPRLSTGDKGGWEGIEVVRHQVGLRPAREGGPRVELDRREGGGVVHAYGFGSAGFQASLGAAERVAEIVMRYLDGQRGG